MCWITYDKTRSHQIKAEKDIKVFKIVEPVDENIVKPYYMYQTGMVYMVGMTYTTEMYEPVDQKGTYVIEIGFHSYGKDCPMAFTDKTNLIFTHLIEVFSKNDKNVRIGRYETHFDIGVINCTIPKGATYYENENGEFVSDSIRIDSIEPLIKI